MDKQWLVILNPHAGGNKGRQDKKQIEDLLEKFGFQFKLIETEYPKHAIDLVRNFLKKGYTHIIAAGGDGTLNEIVNGIFKQDFVDVNNIVIGMIPVGTGNDWIRTFDIPADYKKSLQVIKQNKQLKQDIGKITFSDLHNNIQESYFANMAGFGFDAMVANKANQLKAKNKSGFVVYMYSLLSSFVKYKSRKTHIIFENTTINDYIFSASVGIGKFNGGGMMQAPFAVPDNGEFQLTVIKKINVLTLIRNIGPLYSGQFTKNKNVSVYNARKVLVNGSVIQGEADGESIGTGIFEVEIIPKKLCIIYGSDKYLSK